MSDMQYQRWACERFGETRPFISDVAAVHGVDAAREVAAERTSGEERMSLRRRALACAWDLPQLAGQATSYDDYRFAQATLLVDWLEARSADCDMLLCVTALETAQAMFGGDTADELTVMADRYLCFVMGASDA